MKQYPLTIAMGVLRTSPSDSVKEVEVMDSMERPVSAFGSEGPVML